MGSHVVHLAQALLLKPVITDCQHLIDNENLGF
jgi:hypothetical protein